MNNDLNQKIVICTELTNDDNALILNGIKLASIFNKELCLLYNYPVKRKKQHHEFRKSLQEYSAVVKKDVPNLKVSTLLLNESKGNLPDVLAEKFECIMLVANAVNFSQYSKCLSESPVPFLFVHPNSQIMEFDQLVQPMDLRKENSDCSLWCSYFGRFNKAEIVVVAANDKSKEGKYNISKNAELTRKLYKKFNIKHKLYKGNRSSFRVSFEALDLALASDCNLLVILGSSAVTPVDYLIGLPERKIIKQAGKLPVMVINPRRDNFILCD